MPDKHPKEEFIAFGVKWTPGARKLVLWAILMAAGGGVVGFWDQIAQMLSSAPVWAFVVLLAFSCIIHTPTASATASPPDDAAPVTLVTVTYGTLREEILP